MLHNVYSLWAVCLQLLFRICPINTHKILSFNYGGHGYGDNGKYVCDALISKDKNICVIWPLSAGHKLGLAPANVKAVKFHSIAFFYHLATAKIWLSNSRVPTYFRKRKNQYYIQLWHGVPALKRIEADAQDSLSNSYIQSAKHDSKLADLFISNSKYWTNFIRRTFWYNGSILECGTPRLDRLINRNAEIKKGIRAKINITESCVVLYAPTFRKDMSLDCYALEYLKLRNTLEEKTGKSWHVCVRLHPNMTSSGVMLPQIEGVTDCSKHADMYELMEMADLLITDYSSTMFEAGFANIPVILFATDIEKYRRDRNFYFDLAELPYPLVTSNEKLFEKIKHWDEKTYTQAVSQFNHKLGIKELGRASQELAQHILCVMGQERKTK